MRRIWEPIFMGRQLALWLILGALTGALVGVVVTYFLKLLFWSIAVTAAWPFWAIAIALPLGGLITGLLIHYGAPSAAGHGTEAVIRAVHRESGRINWKVAPIKALATVTTIAPGGSAGKEGPSAQIGAAVASALADLFRFSPEQRKKIVICGIGAGFAAVFGTPVAGAILGIEVLAVGDLWYEMLLPSFAASVMSYEVSRGLGLTWFYPRTAAALPFSLSLFGRLIILGIAAGLVAYLLVLLMDGLHHQMQALETKRHWWMPWFPFLSGIMLVILLGVTNRQYGGLSLSLLSHALEGHGVPTFAFAFKLLTVAITLGFGMSGGIITPLFVIGATFGSMAAIPLHLPLAVGAELGMIAVTAAGANAPIALIIMGMELFGSRLAPDFLIVAIPAFIMIGNHSVYPSQQVRLQKSPWVPIPLGKALEDAPEAPLPLPWTRTKSQQHPEPSEHDVS
ncbi:MAG: chloride channel protein [Sulfobacillus acidophilus]|uniref:Chloride channel protein n=1 Tax=Sulfobacillus acidophilus TaxID=53633 RepID=A0A2T2WIP3_9FIRM|nr:MAG: chloride channel protein [Sulfobacillus acidophilus]